MFKYYNPNPTGRVSVGDCAVRALTKVLGVDWDDAFNILVDTARLRVVFLIALSAHVLFRVEYLISC
jgi:hypothetical protein